MKNALNATIRIIFNVMVSRVHRKCEPSASLLEIDPIEMASYVVSWCVPNVHKYIPFQRRHLVDARQ